MLKNYLKRTLRNLWKNSVDGAYKVTGVFRDLPANCYYHFEWLSPYTTWEDKNTWLKPWNNLSQPSLPLGTRRA